MWTENVVDTIIYDYLIKDTHHSPQGDRQIEKDLFCIISYKKKLRLHQNKNRLFSNVYVSHSFVITDFILFQTVFQSLEF